MSKETKLARKGEGDTIETGDALIAQGFRFCYDLKLADGEGIFGIYRGPGTPREIVDEKDGTVRSVPTFLIEKGSVTYSIVAGVKLVRLLGALAPGVEVAIVRIGDVPVKGGKQRMTDYTVGVRQ